MFTQSDIYRIYRAILIYSYRIYIITQHTMKKNNIRQGPHKFQHLAKQAGTPMEAILKALTRKRYWLFYQNKYDAYPGI